MPADSIANLAVILTGDAAPLTAAMQKSLRDADKWQLGMARISQQAAASWNAGLARLGSANPLAGNLGLGGPGGPMEAFDQSKLIPSSVKNLAGPLKDAGGAFDVLTSRAAAYTKGVALAERSTLRMGMALSAARGNWAAMANLAISGGPTTALVAATIAAGALAFKLAAVSDAQKVAAGASTADTWAGQWERAGEAANDIAVVLGRPIADVLAKETGDVASILEFIAHGIMPDYIREEQKLIALKEKQKAIEKEAAKVAEEAAKKAAEDARELGEFLERKGRDMQSRADEIAKSVRIPREELVGTLAELSQLFEAGFLSAENYKRAAEEAGEKFRKATELKDKASKQAKELQGVGAATSATSAGFSALHKAARFQQTQAELQKEQLREQVKANQILEDLRKDLSKQEADIIINEVSF